MRLSALTLEQLRGLDGHVRRTLEDFHRFQATEDTDTDYAEPRKPGLAGRSDEALKLLVAPLDDLVLDLAQSAREVAGVTQAVVPAARGEMAAALLSLGMTLEEAGRQYNDTVGPAWDMHLQRWIRRHHGVVDRLVADLGAAGREVALTELALSEAEPISQTSAEWARLPARFEGIGETLGVELRTGTPRAFGLVRILDSARTLGAMALYLRRLHDAMRPALELLADQVTWTSYAEGYRLGAIDGTHAILREAGALPEIGLVLTTATLSETVRATLASYRWSGPQDEKTCGPCGARKQQIVHALSIDEMPCCQSECAMGLACRHHWMKV